MIQRVPWLCGCHGSGGCRGPGEYRGPGRCHGSVGAVALAGAVALWVSWLWRVPWPWRVPWLCGYRGPGGYHGSRILPCAQFCVGRKAKIMQKSTECRVLWVMGYENLPDTTLESHNASWRCRRKRQACRPVAFPLRHSHQAEKKRHQSTCQHMWNMSACWNARVLDDRDTSPGGRLQRAMSPMLERATAS